MAASKYLQGPGEEIGSEDTSQENPAPISKYLRPSTEGVAQEARTQLSGPKNRPGYFYVPEHIEPNHPENYEPAHYEGPTGEWHLPEDLERADEERAKADAAYSRALDEEAKRRTESAPPGAQWGSSFIHGATIGHGPQVEAGLRYLMGSDYEAEKAIARRQLEDYRDRHRYLSMLGELGGAGLSMVAAPEILPTKAASALEYLNPMNIGRLGRWVGELPFISRNAFQTAGASIPYGAAYASGESQAPILSAEHAGDVLRGARTAGEMGFILGPAGAGVGKALVGTKNYLAPTRNSAAEEVSHHIAASGVNGQDLIDQMVPRPSPQLKQQGVTQEKLAEMIIRKHEGESTADIAKNYNVSESTLNKYFNEHKKTIEVPSNVLSATRGATGEEGKLSITPLEREARKTAALQGIPRPWQIDPESALKAPLVRTQERIASQIENIAGGNMAESLEKARKLKEVEAKKDYSEVDRSENAINRQREDIAAHHQKLADQTAKAQKELNSAQTALNYENNLYDHQKFERLGLSADERAAMDAAHAAEQKRLSEEIEKKKDNLNQAIDFQKNAVSQLGHGPAGLDVRDVILKHRDIARKEFQSNPEAWEKFHNVIDAFFEHTPIDPNANLYGRAASRPDYNRPIQTIRDFQQARKNLNTAISQERNSIGGNKDLVSKLVQFKNDLNDRAWKYNHKLKEADAKWSEGATTEDILKHAEGATLHMGAKAREQLEYFDKLNNRNKEIFRIGFAESLRNNILNKPLGSATIINLFSTPAAREVAIRILGAAKANRLIENLERERNLFISSANVLSGSRTGPLSEDMRRQMELIHAGVSAMSGAPHAAAQHLRHAASYLWGSRAAAAKNALMMTTSPAEAIKNAYLIKNAPQNILARNQRISDLSRAAALGAQNVLRSNLPYQPREGQ